VENAARFGTRPKLVPELICSDLDQSLQFYLGLLRFQILYARPEDRFAFLHRDGAEIMLEQPHIQDRLWPRAELTKPFGRGVNFQIQVSDVGELHDAVVGAGIECVLPLEERWYRRNDYEIGVRQFAIQDPDGYLIRLSQSLATRPVAA
jgi:catechol 2,3-dioxygenase-like lactoylglutathione lyase family enzyme